MGKKVAMVANEAWNMYNFRKALISELLAEGYTITVIVSKDEFTEKLIEMGVEVIDIAMNPKSTSLVENIKIIIDLTKLYRKNKYDVVFHYTIKPIVLGSIAAKIARVKSVAVTTGLGYAFINEKTKISRLVNYLYKVSLKLTEEVWFLNNQDKEEFLTRGIIPENKSFVLPGEGIDLEEFKPRPKVRDSEVLVFLMIGRALWDKGAREYCEAAEKIVQNNQGVEFWFVGKIGVSNPSAVPREFIESYEKKGVINYLGTTDDIGNIIKDADCIVLPSYREGISRVIMESASMEKPVIATDVPGCRELINDSLNGFLCKPRSSSDLEKKIERFIQLSKEDRVKMGLYGRKKMYSEFSMGIVNEIYKHFLKKLQKETFG